MIFFHSFFIISRRTGIHYRLDFTILLAAISSVDALLKVPSSSVSSSSLFRASTSSYINVWQLSTSYVWIGKKEINRTQLTIFVASFLHFKQSPTNNLPSSWQINWKKYLKNWKAMDMYHRTVSKAIYCFEYFSIFYIFKAFIEPGYSSALGQVVTVTSLTTKKKMRWWDQFSLFSYYSWCN